MGEYFDERFGIFGLNRSKETDANDLGRHNRRDRNVTGESGNGAVGKTWRESDRAAISVQEIAEGTSG